MDEGTSTYNNLPGDGAPIIGVLGAGALGCYLGVLLADSGQQMRFLLRSDYESAVQNGLKVTFKDRPAVRVFPAPVYSAAEEIGACDLVIVALKTTANSALGDLLRPMLGRDTVVLTVQNGMGNVELLEKLLPRERICTMLCHIGATRMEPAVIHNFTDNYGVLSIAEAAGAPTGRTRAVAEIFSRAGFVTHVLENFEEAIWRKLIWNVPFNGLAIAKGGITTDKICADPAMAAEARELMEELQAAAAARGFAIPDSYINKQFKITPALGEYKPSSLVDWQNGRALEVESIWGEPLRRGKAAGVAMPRLEALYAKLCEENKG